MSTAGDSFAKRLSQNLDDYDGQWVAVRGRLVVAHALDEQALRRDPVVRDDDLLYPIGDPASGFYMINV